MSVDLVTSEKAALKLSQSIHRLIEPQLSNFSDSDLSRAANVKIHTPSYSQLARILAVFMHFHAILHIDLYIPEPIFCFVCQDLANLNQKPS
jgi:hypothetical protein